MDLWWSRKVYSEKHHLQRRNRNKIHKVNKVIVIVSLAVKAKSQIAHRGNLNRNRKEAVYHLINNP